jgi:ABC-type Fe3+-hydroxamate transport system substrate-binding protein
MDDQTRNDLLSKLADAKRRETKALQQLERHAARIEQVREAIGNPYFYSGRSGDDPESKAHFSG